jgi:hypothetical protein
MCFRSKFTYLLIYLISYIPIPISLGSIIEHMREAGITAGAGGLGEGSGLSTIFVGDGAPTFVEEISRLARLSRCQNRADYLYQVVCVEARTETFYNKALPRFPLMDLHL